MKEIVVASGKGGTGKTSIAAALGVVAGPRAAMADCDVDAANLHLLYEPRHQETHEFWSGKTAVIDPAVCTHCGTCVEKCRFGAIAPADTTARTAGAPVVDPMSCEGCAVCYHLCPEDAISMIDVMAGKWFVSKSRFDHWFVHARLGIGQDSSGKLVSKVKDVARAIASREGNPFVIVDGPPGIGCPVIATFSGADHVLIVTEATISGAHDLRRVLTLARQFGAETSCVINKADLNEDARREMELYCESNEVEVICRIPFSTVFYDALQDGKTLLETGDDEIERAIIDIWEHLERSAPPR